MRIQKEASIELMTVDIHLDTIVVVDMVSFQFYITTFGLVAAFWHCYFVVNVVYAVALISICLYIRCC